MFGAMTFFKNEILDGVKVQKRTSGFKAGLA
jgi:hypothetical protein